MRNSKVLMQRKAIVIILKEERMSNEVSSKKNKIEELKKVHGWQCTKAQNHTETYSIQPDFTKLHTGYRAGVYSYAIW